MEEQTRIDYHDNGQISQRCILKNNQLHGKATFYNEMGQLTQELQFENNVLNGIGLMYDEESNLSQALSFKEGVLEGESCFYEEGILNSKINYKKDSPLGQASEMNPLMAELCHPKIKIWIL